MSRNPIPWLLTLVRGGRTYRVWKRGLDIGFSLVALTLLFPFFLIAAVAVATTSPGGVLFKSERVGLSGKPFVMLKLRSMYDGSHRDYHAIRDSDSSKRNGPFYKHPEDPRITPVGKFIRRFSIDELPQFWNVLIGDMSVVGPRPAFDVEIREMGPHGTRRLDVKPGITGLCQISGRSNLPFDDCVRLEEIYIQKANILLDLWVIAKTLGVALRKVGAH